MKQLIVFLALFSLMTFMSKSHADYESSKPYDYVPNKSVATCIAEGIWVQLYGKKEIESEKPFKASLKDGIWEVEGTLPANTSGGTAFIKIRKIDGKVLDVYHEK